MRPLLRTALAAMACAVLAACSDEPTSASRTPSVLRPSLETVPVPPPVYLQVITPCDINALKADARLYTNKSNDVLQTIIGDLGSAVRNGLSTAGNDKAFDGLARMAAIRGTSAQKAGVTGAVFDRLVKRFVGCMQPALYAGVLEPDPPTSGGGGGFKQALGDGWVFEVRGGTTDADAAALERATSTPSTWWAVDRADPTWVTSTLTNRVLIYGWRTGNFIESDARAGSSFEHRTLPKTNKPGGDDGADYAVNANVGLCFADDTQITGTQRVNHANQFLPLILNGVRCGLTTPTAIIPTTGSLAFGRLNPMHLAQRAVSFFSPQTLYATSMFFGGSITGRPDDFSPSAVIDLSQVKLVFDPIANSFVDSVLTSNTSPAHEVRVYAYTLDNVLIPGVDVVVKISGNASTISFFGGTTPTDSTTIITADSVIAKGTLDGYARLTNVAVTKAGGFTLSARVNVVGVSSNPFNSLSFNIQNK
jgi:hypothetical protein